MKSGIHPKYRAVVVKCSCGSEFCTKSTVDDHTISISVCNKCHPFYTGKQKIVDTAGRVDNFYRRFK